MGNPSLQPCGRLPAVQGEVVGVTVHPGKKYAITASADASWCFYDLEAATCLKQVQAGARP